MLLMGKVGGLTYYCMNIIEDNNSGWSIRDCLLLGVILVGIIVNGVILLALSIVGVTWLVPIFLFVTIVI